MGASKYSTIQGLFEVMNQEEYLVMRNFDNLICDVMEDKEDIDILCRSRERMVSLIGAKYRWQSDVCYNYYVEVNDLKVRIDIREVGDNYYDRKWEEAILKNRVAKDCFFVMDKNNYIYSLLYHALIHKSYIKEEYLNFIADSIPGLEKGLVPFGKELVRFMKKNKYRFVKPDDIHVSLNRRNYFLLSVLRIIWL